jgi:hypothetical protein
MPEWKCPRCQQAILPADTIRLSGADLAHVDCQKPRDVSHAERALLFRYCWNHEVARCPACAKSFRREELAADLLEHRSNLCPRCRADLTESVRGHLYSCAMLPAEVRQRARDARDAAGKLVKQGRQAADSAEVLMRETEAALSALRETMRRTFGG